MIVRPYARFQSTLPEDIIENEEGLFVQPPGRSVADAVVELFRELGCEVYFGPEPVLDIAWEIGVQAGGRNFRVGVNLVEDYWFFIVNPSWLDKMLGRRPAAYLDLLRRFAQKLADDGRFSNVRWYVDRSEADTAGASAPVEGR